ncbi:unnamed protein product [Strongylus vulgaris]|uniref:Uncharacterized protein n=1 Tax=Strongylus vulgaris TaxID=40348 RepID=A0A3P7KK86_STRVU|nr:unnamed protein product [Strongylus vulgaris]
MVLELEGQSVWVYGGASCSAYPLTKIDTINEVTGEMNEESALSLVVYGKTSEHLELLDGILENILNEKWKAYGKHQCVFKPFQNKEKFRKLVNFINSLKLQLAAFAGVILHLLYHLHFRLYASAILGYDRG